MKRVGREIAARCGGVALAAQSLGYTLKGKKSDEWESVRDNYIWSLSTSEDSSSIDHVVLASLLLSYSRMPDWLKLCFSYCAVFPKGHNIAKHDLIHQWIALGFTEPSRIFNTMQLCEKYVTQLLGMSFLQYSKTSSSDRRQDKDATLFTMHDLVHDLAKEILAHQINTGGNSCRYALLTDCSKSLRLSFPANIRALHFRDCGKQKLCGGAFSPAKCLRVLDLSECIIQKLPDCIGQLKQLRFLHATEIQDDMIPNCITELSELNYLNLRGSRNISALPESIGDMKTLMHLDLAGCSGIRELPVSFAELKQLVHLDLSYLSECHMPTSKVFCGFTKLQYLNLYFTNIRGLPTVIGNLIKLRYLNLGACMQLCKIPVGSLLHSISTLSNLEHLDLSNNYNLFTIPESISNLRKLHTLNLRGCKYQLPDSMYQMVSLKVLIASKKVALDESVLSRLNIPVLPHFVVHASSDKCSSNISLLQHSNPEELTIDRLENVKSAEEAQSIKLMEKQKIEELSFIWTVAAGRFVDDKEVLEKLVPPSSVRTLSMIGYRSVSLPGWFMDIRQYLPNLSDLVLCDFPNCNNPPPLGLLPNLQRLYLNRMEGLEEWNTTHYSGKEGSNELMFPRLEMLRIEQCAKLRIKPCLPSAGFLKISGCDTMLSSWGESSSHSGASSSSPIVNLTVEDSKVPMHQWRLLHHLPALHQLTITSCSDLTTPPPIFHSLSSLKSLCLKLLSLAELPRWLVELTSLQELNLSRCASMTSVPEWLGELTSLKDFSIENCEGIRSLPDSIQELTSLKCFWIVNCEGIRSLPDSIQQLTKLKQLGIQGCPTLVKWCKSKQNKMKLAHIEEVFCGSACGDEEDEADGSSYMGMQGEQQAPRLINLLPEHCTVWGVKSDEEVIAETVEETTDNQDTASGPRNRINNKRKRPSQQPEFPSKPGGRVAEDSSFCGDNIAPGSAYMGTQEEQRVLTQLINLLTEHCTIRGETADEEVMAETVEETTDSLAVDTNLRLFTC